MKMHIVELNFPRKGMSTIINLDNVQSIVLNYKELRVKILFANSDANIVFNTDGNKKEYDAVVDLLRKSFTGV